MSKILQITAGLFATIAICGISSGNETNGSVRQWTPTATSNCSENKNSDVQTASSHILPSLRMLDPFQMRNIHVERLAPLQVETPFVDIEKISQILTEGEALLTQRRWHEAKKCFEQGLRICPENFELRSGFAQARRRQEIETRYQDSTFTSLTSDISIGDLMKVLDEILQDVDRYHVDCPAYSELFKLGFDGVAEALLEETFFIHNNLNPTSQHHAQKTLAKLRGKTSEVPLATREDLRYVVLWISNQLQKDAFIPVTATMSEFICSAVCSLDAYSSPLTPTQVDDVFSLIDGHFVGLGVELKTESPTKVVRVIQHSPAEEAGIVIGDEIVSIDGRPTSNLTSAEVGELLQGQEGEEITLLLRNTDRVIRKVVAKRRPINVPSVENVHLLNAPGKIGYVKITCFQKTTADELLNAINELSTQNIHSLIVDLRQNPGGLLQEAINVSDVFLDSGIIVQTRGRNGYHSFQANRRPACSLPLVILVDANSASAAEIFAGAMQENNRAVIVGSQSYGKGTVQAIVQLNCNTSNPKPIAGLRLTTEAFYSPKGRAYAGVGVIPNVDITSELATNNSTEKHLAPTKPAYTELIIEDSSSMSSIANSYGYIPTSAKRKVISAETESDVYLSIGIREALKLEKKYFIQGHNTPN